FLNSVLATSDGGCLLVGTKYPHGSPSLIRYSHFVKVDANGDVQWTQDIEMPELSYKVYPNPTQSVFNIENSELNIIQIELYDISGRYLTSISDCSNSTISIDLSPFSNGIYFAKIKSSKGVRTEKVVKN
ncbi:MAG: calx-beta domain protein, partial [Bacteroidetes bacterium]|nr:calx-beta domain protein [Bacteroidota bacterium]